jgi:hypothetical protein
MAQGILSGNCCANYDNEIGSAIPARQWRLLSRPMPPSAQADPVNVQYSSSGRKIPSLPNNRTNEMIRGCEIRSISGPPPRPLYDDTVERRLVVHGF